MIQVINSPQSNFTYRLDCDSGQISFSGQSLASADYTITGWYWDFGDGSSSQAQNPVHQFKQPGMYTVKLITTASSRCTGSSSQEVHVNGMPVADFTFSGLPCVNNTLVFKSQSVAAANDYIVSWSWDFGHFGSSALPQPEITFVAAQPLTVPVSLTVITAAGCQASISRLVALQALPAVSFTYQPLSELTPLQIQFSASIGMEAVRYRWDFGDEKVSEQKDPLHIFEQSGTYKVALSAENASGCVVTVVKEIIVTTVPDIFELKLENIEVTRVNNQMHITAYVYNNSPFTLHALDFPTLLNGHSKVVNNWQGELPPGKGIKHSYSIPASNTATVCVTAEDPGRKYTSNRQCASLENQVIFLDPYPNPARGQVTLPLILTENTDIEIKVVDVLGKNCGQLHTGLLLPGFHEIYLDTAHLKPGLYFIQYKSTDARTSRKIIVQ
jgi:PKD repeat protein